MRKKDVSIFVIDDERMVRESMVAYLEDEGFTVYGFESAEDALSLMQRYIPDISIVDLRLPGINGSDFVLQTMAAYPGIRYIIHTGAANYVLSPELIAAGLAPEDVFQKPILNLETLVRRISRILSL